jgi:hypothetical protein
VVLGQSTRDRGRVGHTHPKKAIGEVVVMPGRPRSSCALLVTALLAGCGSRRHTAFTTNDPSDSESCAKRDRSAGAHTQPAAWLSVRRYASFRVSGIPGATGFSLGGTSGGINVAFAHADYYYLVGMGGGGPADIARLNSPPDISTTGSGIATCSLRKAPAREMRPARRGYSVTPPINEISCLRSASA